MDGGGFGVAGLGGGGARAGDEGDSGRDVQPLRDGASGVPGRAGGGRDVDVPEMVPVAGGRGVGGVGRAERRDAGVPAGGGQPGRGREGAFVRGDAAVDAAEGGGTRAGGGGRVAAGRGVLPAARVVAGVARAGAGAESRGVHDGGNRGAVGRVGAGGGVRHGDELRVDVSDAGVLHAGGGGAGGGGIPAADRRVAGAARGRDVAEDAEFAGFARHGEGADDVRFGLPGVFGPGRVFPLVAGGESGGADVQAWSVCEGAVVPGGGLAVHRSGGANGVLWKRGGNVGANDPCDRQPMLWDDIPADDETLDARGGSVPRQVWRAADLLCGAGGTSGALDGAAPWHLRVDRDREGGADALSFELLSGKASVCR